MAFIYTLLYILCQDGFLSDTYMKTWYIQKPFFVLLFQAKFSSVTFLLAVQVFHAQ